MARKLGKHIQGLIDQFTVLLNDHKAEITKMVSESESESATIPVSLFVSDAPGTQRVSVKMTLTKKEVFSKAVDIDTGQTKLTAVDDQAKKESLAAKQKTNASKERVVKGLKKNAETADAPK